MEAKMEPYSKGEIYFLSDMTSSYNVRGNFKHPYLVIDTKSQARLETNQGFIEVMGMTSQKNHDVHHEIPILGYDGYIGYIVPYNIYSYDASEFNRNSYKGTLQNTSWGTKEDFIQMLLEYYMFLRGFSSDKKIVKKVKKYKKWFSKKYKEYDEYKYKKVSLDRTKIYPKPIKNKDTLVLFKEPETSDQEQEDSEKIFSTEEDDDESPNGILQEQLDKLREQLYQPKNEDKHIPSIKDAIMHPENYTDDEIICSMDNIVLTTGDGDDSIKDTDITKINRFLSNSRGKKLKQMSDDDITFFNKIITTLDPEEVASKMKCTLANVYNKKRSIRTEISRRGLADTTITIRV